MSAKFGGATSGGSTFTSHKTFDIKDGTQRYRLLPSMKSLIASGTWAVFQREHFGYRATDRKDPTKTKIRTFLCIEKSNPKTKMVEVSCPECREIENKKQLRDDREKEIRDECKAKGILDSDKIEAIATKRLQDIDEWLKAHNLSKNWYVNVMTEDGEFGVLRMRHTAKQALDVRIEECRNRKMDPFAIGAGVFFEFKRSGKGRDTTYTVDVAMDMQEVNGQVAMMVKRGPLTEALGDKADAECPDLTSVGRKLSRDQIQLLVETNGDPAEVDAVFGLPDRVEKSPGANLGATQAAKPAPVAPAAAKPTPKPVEVVKFESAPGPEVTADDDEAALEAQMATLKAKMAAAKKPKAPAPAAPVLPQQQGRPRRPEPQRRRVPQGH
jgi:hypothetical protein